MSTQAPTQTPAPARTMSVKTAASVLNYAPRHIRRLIKQGAIIKYQRGPHCEVRLDAEQVYRLRDQWGR